MSARTKKSVKAKRSSIHRRRRFLGLESFEDRRMMAFSPWDDTVLVLDDGQPDALSPGVSDVAGYRFADLASAREIGQAAGGAAAEVERIHLDFDGARNLTFDGPSPITGIDIEPFRAGRFGLNGQESALIERIVNSLEQRYAGAEIEFTTTEPADAASQATVYIGPNATQFTDRAGLLGIAEHVDAGNAVLTDEAFVDSSLVGEAIGAADVREYADALAAVIAHEIDHLRGWGHAAAEEFDEEAIAAVAASSLPNVPTLNSAVAVSSTEVSLRWTNSSYEDGYRIWQWTGTAWQKVAETQRDRTDILIRGLRANTTYYFLIEAYNSTGSRYSPWKAVTTPTDVQRVTAPTLSTLQALSSTQVKLTWSNVSNEDGYRILKWSGQSWE